MNKFLLALLLSASLAFAFTSGDGTYENPYEIAGQSDIVNLIDMVATNNCSGLHFLQTADIDLTPFGNFQGIGGISDDMSTTNAFSGDYDGGGYWISNMFCSVVSADNYASVGFFKAVDGGTIQNLSVQGAITSSFTNAQGFLDIGGVVASVNGNSFLEGLTSLVNIDVAVANISVGGIACKVAVGGVVGKAKLSAPNSWIGLNNYGNVMLHRSSASCFVSGIIGCHRYDNTSSSVIKDCFNYGKVKNNCIYPKTEYYSDSVGRGRVSGIVNLSLSYPTTIAHCINYGKIECANTEAGGVALGLSSTTANKSAKVRYCSNFGDTDYTSDIYGWWGIGGCIGGNSIYGEAIGITNYGNIRVNISANSSSGASRIYVSGVSWHAQGEIATFLNGGNSYFANFGDVIVSNSYAKPMISVGGIFCHGVANNFTEAIRLHDSANFGKVKLFSSVNTNSAEVLSVAGICSLTTVGSKARDFYGSNVANLGEVSLEVLTADTFADISGICSARDSGYPNKVVLSNCYNLGSVKWEGKGIYVGGLMGEANSSHDSADYTYIRNCYSYGKFIGDTTSNYVGTLVGHFEKGDYLLAMSNCFAVCDRDIPSIGVYVSGATNNLATYTYEQFYRDPNSQAFLYNYAFTNSGRDTNSFYDLALPINKLLFPTITDEVKQKHNWTRLNGYKRYIRTIQQ